MTKCRIEISMISENEAREHAPEECEFDLALRCEVELQDASMGDKMQLMHTMSKALHLDRLDIMLYAMAEAKGHFDKNTTTVPTEA